jgi:hypothetical protein
VAIAPLQARSLTEEIRCATTCEHCGDTLLEHELASGECLLDGTLFQSVDLLEQGALGRPTRGGQRAMPGRQRADRAGCQWMPGKRIEQGIACTDHGIEIRQRWDSVCRSAAHRSENLKPEPQFSESHRIGVAIDAKEAPRHQMTHARGISGARSMEQGERTDQEGTGSDCGIEHGDIEECVRELGVWVIDSRGNILLQATEPRREVTGDCFTQNGVDQARWGEECPFLFAFLDVHHALEHSAEQLRCHSTIYRIGVERDINPID